MDNESDSENFVWTEEDEKEEQEIIRRAEEAVKRGKRVRVKVDLGNSAVLSVRLPHQLLKDLEITAHAHDLAPATFARRAIEESVALSASGIESATHRLSVMARLIPLIEKDLETIKKIPQE
ncbi:MAG TPA: hypothetical protein PKB15_03545 [Acidimicrobiia bacterium]|nr:hypothetical protein [Acidimicrobiia bacterium]